MPLSVTAFLQKNEQPGETVGIFYLQYTILAEHVQYKALEIQQGLFYLAQRKRLK